MDRLAEELLESAELVDRCICCGSERTPRMRRTISRELGGVAASAKFTVEYCADSVACGEWRAMEIMDTMAATFLQLELRRRGTSIMDLGVPDSE